MRAAECWKRSNGKDQPRLGEVNWVCQLAFVLVCVCAIVCVCLMILNGSPLLEMPRIVYKANGAAAKRVEQHVDPKTSSNPQ